MACTNEYLRQELLKLNRELENNRQYMINLSKNLKETNVAVAKVLGQTYEPRFEGNNTLKEIRIDLVNAVNDLREMTKKVEYSGGNNICEKDMAFIIDKVADEVYGED